MIVACGRFYEARRYAYRLPRRDVGFANAFSVILSFLHALENEVGCTGATAPGCIFLGAGREKVVACFQALDKSTAADEGERYAICLRRLDRASFPQWVCRSARRAKPAECFGATGLSGQCVVLWRAELGRVPIEAAYFCKELDAHTSCRPAPGVSCHEGDARSGWRASSPSLKPPTLRHVPWHALGLSSRPVFKP